jgi:hypothetical protein
MQGLYVVATDVVVTRVPWDVLAAIVKLGGARWATVKSIV